MGMLRLLLALSVVVAHAGPIFGLTLIPSRQAVEIFFVISGFYMSLILTTKYHSVTTFYLNRALRLYPTYLLIVLASWAMFFAMWLYLGRMPTNTWVEYYADMPASAVSLIAFSNWTMIGQDVLRLLHYKLGAGFSFMHFGPTDAPDGAKWVGEFQATGQAWSLGTEVWFYLLAPLVVRTRWQILAGMMVASFTLRAFMLSAPIDYSYFFFPANLGFFLAGVLLQRAQGHFDRLAHYLPIVCIGTIAFALAASPSEPQAAYALIPFVPAFFAWTKRSSLDQHVGELSYPIFLVHGLITATLGHSHITSSVAVCALSILAAFLIRRYVEKPIDIVRQQISRRAN